VTGTVAAYSVNPLLPSGLTLAASSGVISGTPTAVSALASYTVTAANASGSTTAMVAIVVDVAPPSISYGSSLFTLTTGVPAQGVAPTNSGGAAAGWSISPALPAGLGLTFDTTNGSIGGTPTATAAPATYVVTAQNSSGKSTASFTLGVQTVLLDLGHRHQIATLRLTSSRVLSLDVTNYWVLWNYASGAKITSGPTACKSHACVEGAQAPVDLKGTTFVDESVAGLEVRSSSDGSLLAVIPSPLSWWKLATDGSYVCAGSPSALTVWSPGGTVITSRTGDYSKAVAFAAPTQVQVALGPAGTNVVETVSVPSGSPSVGPAFLGDFNSWFVDGQRFLSNAGNTIWTYTRTGVQEDFTTLPTVQNLTGQGGWFWTYANDAVNLYKVGASGAPAATYSAPFLAPVIPSGLTLAILNATGGTTVIDLSGASPATMNFTAPVGHPSAYASSGSQWLLGNWAGVLLDGTSIAGTPRYLGYGAAWSIAGSNPWVAVATASGQILYFDAATNALLGTINFSSSQLALSSDGTVLAAAGDQLDSIFHTDWSIRIYSLPSAALINTFAYTVAPGATLPSEITLSASGTVLGQVLSPGLSSATCSRTLTAVTGAPLLWSDTFTSIFDCRTGDPVLISPDGTQVAVSSETMYPTSATKIYRNGMLVTAVPGWAVAWLDDSRILVHKYSFLHAIWVYSGSTIYGSTGIKLSSLSLPLPEPQSLQVVSSDSAYDPRANAIYSTTTGQVMWTSASPSTGVGAVAGSNVVFASASQVVVQSY
jgi:hypothetical protein